MQNVTPLVKPFPNEPAPEPIELQEIIDRVGRAMGSVSVMAAAHPNDVTIGEPDFRRACEAIENSLNDVLTRLHALEDAIRCGDLISVYEAGEPATVRCGIDPEVRPRSGED